MSDTDHPPTLVDLAARVRAGKTAPYSDLAAAVVQAEERLRALAGKHQGFADWDVDREDVTGRIVAAVHNGFASELRALLGKKA